MRAGSVVEDSGAVVRSLIIGGGYTKGAPCPVPAQKSQLPRAVRLSRGGTEGRTLSAMPNDVVQLLIGLTVLIVLAISFGIFSARLFMWATRGSGDGPKP